MRKCFIQARFLAGARAYPRDSDLEGENGIWKSPSWLGDNNSYLVAEGNQTAQNTHEEIIHRNSTQTVT